MAKTQLKPISSSAWARIQEVCRLSFRPCFFERLSPSPPVSEEEYTSDPEPHNTKPYNDRANSTTIDEGFIIVHGPNDASKHELEEPRIPLPPPKRRKITHRRVGGSYEPAPIPSKLDGTTTTHPPPPNPTQTKKEKREPPTSNEIDWLEAAFDSQTLLSTLTGEEPMTPAQREATILDAISQRQSELHDLEANIRLLTSLYECKERIFIEQERDQREALNKTPNTSWHTHERAREQAHRERAKSLASLWRDRMSFMKKRVAKLRSIELWERRLRVLRGESRVRELKAEVSVLVASIVEPTLDGEGRMVSRLDMLD